MSIVNLGGTEVNLSIADALLPLLALVALRRHAFWVRPDSNLLYGYVFLTLTSLVLSLWWASLTSTVVLSSAVLTILKLCVALVYLVLLARLMTASVARGDYLFVTVWSWASAAIALAALGSSLLGISALTRQTAFRNSGSFDDPNLFAIYLLVSAGVSLWLHDRTGRSLPLLATGIALLAIPTTASRGGAVALVAAVLVAVAWMSWRNKIRLLAVAVTAALVLATWGRQLVAGVLESPSVQRIVSNEGGLDSARRELWGFGVRLWGDNLLLGVGPGQFQVLSAGLVDASRGNVVHNTYLSVGVELGLVGFGAFFSLWGLLALKVVRIPGGKGAGLLLAVAGLALGMVTLNLENARFAWALAAFVWAVTRSDLRETADRGEDAPLAARH
ncbi:O-antigen ligase family protein [Serinicoccus sediminis]|uniref:O-antigen ligase family protein n=1 Tax=Serinicoccus sediminis TaxID=2306021 RepID=UPI0013EE1B4E|nr:O-antigen ligase family protein [Serinicoccus sediminis]